MSPSSCTQVSSCPDLSNTAGDILPKAMDFPVQQLVEALNTSKIGLAVCDRRLRYTTVNQRVAEIDRLSIQDHLGKTPRQVLGSLSGTFERSLKCVFATGKSLPNVKTVGLLSGGTESAAYINTFFPLMDYHQKMMQVGVFIMEVAFSPKVRIMSEQTGQQDQPISEVQMLLQSYGASLARIQTSRQLVSPRHPSSTLSAREGEVLRLLAEGQSNKEIAWKLAISVKTVESYRSRLMIKLDAHSLVYLVHYAIRNQLVQLQV